MQPLLFNSLISDLDDGTECTFCRFTDVTIVGGMADTPEGCAHIQRCLDRLVKWEKGISLSSTKGSGEEQNTLRATCFGSSLTEKYMEVLVDSKMNTSQWQKGPTAPQDASGVQPEG